MARLTARDLRTLSTGLHTLYDAQDLATLPRHLCALLHQLVPADHISYNEVYPAQQRTVMVVDPPGALPPDTAERLARYMHEHPLITAYQRTRDCRAWKSSDFLSQRQFHRLGLYNELYRRQETEYQMALALPTPPSWIIGLALSRQHRDFSERDRLVLNLFQPHLAQAYSNATVLTQMRQELAALQQAAEAWGGGVIVLTREGQVRLMTESARQWVTAYFGWRPHQAARLPEALERWVRHQQAALLQRDEVPPPCPPLVVTREHTRLVVRLVNAPAAAPLLVLREEQRPASASVALAALGLSQREAEVLWWVAQGKTNPEVGLILGLSRRTVQKHLEHIYVKLGVETRTAAARHVLETVGAARVSGSPPE